jgi:hypothetical protein
MRTTYTIAEWPDAKILRIMPTGGGLDLIGSLVDDVGGTYRLKPGSQSTSLWWGPLKRDEQLVFAYVKKNKEEGYTIPFLTIASTETL